MLSGGVTDSACVIRGWDPSSICIRLGLLGTESDVMVGLPFSLGAWRTSNSLQNYRSCRRSLAVVYLDLELLGHLVRVCWGILGSSAACQLDHWKGTRQLTPGV
jgi:hypothetical protein